MGCTFLVTPIVVETFHFYILGLSNQLTSARRPGVLKVFILPCYRFRNMKAADRFFDELRRKTCSWHEFPEGPCGRALLVSQLNSTIQKVVTSDNLGQTFFFLYWDLKDPSRTMNPPCGVSPPLFIQWKDCRSLSNLSRSKHTTHLVERILHSF